MPGSHPARPGWLRDSRYIAGAIISVKVLTTSRPHLGQPLVCAMINAYFLRNAEQRMAVEKSLQLAEANSTDS